MLRPLIITVCFIIIAVFPFAFHHRAQEANAPVLSVQPTPTPQDEQEQVKVFTEEVLLPVVAYDQHGRFDPSLEPGDVLVLEDGVPQQVRSVRRIPANVLLLLDTGGEARGTGGMSKDTGVTRAVALRVLSSLTAGDWMAAIEFNDRVELIQAWTTDARAAQRAVKTKLHSGKRVRLSEAVLAAVEQLESRPEGSRHVVLVTDGVETVSGRVESGEAIKKLMAARATVHVISYTEFVRQSQPKYKSDPGRNQREAARAMATAGIDPTVPPGTNRGIAMTGPKTGDVYNVDPKLRRQRREYERAVERSQRTLASLAEETGGRMMLPKSTEEMLKESEAVARDIGAQYVVTYAPKRPLAEARAGEYRRVEVAPRRIGLSLRSRRGYVATTAR